MAFETPVLLIIFNRPELTSRVFSVIKRLQPRYLYIAGDGPRKEVSGEKEACQKTRDLVTSGINWPCKLKTLFRTENYGCGKGVSSAIDWFFSEVDYGIILEDDIIIKESFFNYAQELLLKYKEDPRIMMISGFNHQIEWTTKYSYFYAYYGGVWGWATWKRAWNHYDYHLKDWDNIKHDRVLDNVLCQSEDMISDRISKTERVLNGNIDTWDYQWGISRIINSGLSIIPTKSMVSNIGFGDLATHTLNSNSHLNNSPSFEMEFPMDHNPFIVPDRKYDEKFMKSIMPEIKSNHRKQSIFSKLYEKFN